MTINGSTNANNWTFKLEAYEMPNSINIENNTSVVRVDMYIGRANSRSYLGGNYSAFINVDGQNQQFDGNISYPTYINAGDWLYLATKDYTITHTDDGSKVVHIYSEMTSGDFSPSYCSASGDLTLTTIPRASTITATSAYIEETSQLTINRKSNSFTHSIQYSFGNLSGYILADGTISQSEQKITATSIGFTIPSTFYSEIPNSMEAVCTLSIKTYNGDQQIGSTQTTTFYARVNPSTNAPYFTITNMEDSNYNIVHYLTGDDKIFVVGYSLVTIYYICYAQNGSTITSVKVNDERAPLPNEYGGASTRITMSNDIIFSLTDSRGLNTTISILNPPYSKKDYFNPDALINFERVEPTSNYAYLTFNGEWWNNNFGYANNTLSLKWYYRQRNSQSWTLGGTLVNNTDYTISNNTFYSGTGQSASPLTIGGNFTYANAWDIKFEIKDALKTQEIISTMPQGIPIINWDDNHFNVNGYLTQYEQPISGGGGGETLPIGTILEYPATSNLPTGWMICDGSALSRTEYSQLFDVIGISFGAGDGSTTFNIPNKKGRVSVGFDSSQTEFDTIGETGGEKTHTLTKQELPQIDINTSYASSSGGDGSGLVYGTSTGTSNNFLVKNINYGGQAHNNLQPYIVTNFIIKVSLTSGTIGQIVDSLDGSSTTDAPSVRAVKILNTYSSNEIKIGTWINNKPIYRKVVDCGNLPDSTYKNVAHNISNIDEITNIYLRVKTSGNYFYNSNMKGTSDIFSSGTLIVRANATNIQISTDYNYSGHSAYAIIEYTKTTD